VLLSTRSPSATEFSLHPDLDTLEQVMTSPVPQASSRQSQTGCLIGRLVVPMRPTSSVRVDLPHYHTPRSAPYYIKGDRDTNHNHPIQASKASKENHNHQPQAQHITSSNQASRDTQTYRTIFRPTIIERHTPLTSNWNSIHPTRPPLHRGHYSRW
jgi:hypothetical protein